MNKKFIYIPVLFLLFGCSENISPVDSGLANQIYHHGNGSEPQGIDPHVVTGVPEHHILISLCEGLTIPNPNPNDMNGYMAGTAESWSISDDGKEYIFNIACVYGWFGSFRSSMLIISFESLDLNA